jgi:hypothetical protein
MSNRAKPEHIVAPHAVHRRGDQARLNALLKLFNLRADFFVRAMILLSSEDDGK